MIEFKISDFFYPLDLARTHLLLKRSEYWSRSQFERYQSRLLAKLLRFCVNEVPYYGQSFREAGLDGNKIFTDNAMQYLKRLPVLDKDTLRENSALFMAQNAKRFNPKPILTSGTTGTPLTVYWDRGSNVMEFCCIMRIWRWAGFRIGQPFLDLRSRTISKDENHLVKDKDVIYIRNRKVNGLEISSDMIDDSNVHKYYEVLMHYKPRLIRGHPQAIQHLANLIQKKDLDGWKPKVVTTASEALYVFQRKQIEAVWEVPIIDTYGLKEHNAFIAQCLQGQYHIYPEYGICEILNDDFKPVKPGQEGWIIATGLHNYVQPLLRYNTRDRAVKGNSNLCSCRRTLPTVERIIGRIDDCIYTHEGKRFSGLSFAFLESKGLKKARLIQEDLSKVTVELIVTPEFNQTEKEALMDELKRKVEDRIRFEFKYVNEIIQETPGKFKFVVSRLKDYEIQCS